MITHQLLLENVRCFARAEVPIHERVTVVVGQNGSGKTTIAEAIASLAPGERKGLDTFPLRQGAMAGAIKLCDAHGKPLGGWFHGKDGDLTRERLSRPVFVHGQSLFDLDEHLFRDLSAYVARLAKRGEDDEAARRAGEGLWSWLGDMDGPGLQRVEIVEREGRMTTMFHRAGVALPITELSDGYRAMLAVVIDLVMRYCQSFPSLENPLAGEAMVVIDEVGLHLHPRWQRRVIAQLTRLFPRTLFVLTTHSPAVAQAAIDERRHVVVLEERRARSGGTSTIVRRDPEADLPENRTET